MWMGGGGVVCGRLCARACGCHALRLPLLGAYFLFSPQLRRYKTKKTIRGPATQQNELKQRHFPACTQHSRWSDRATPKASCAHGLPLLSPASSSP